MLPMTLRPPRAAPKFTALGYARLWATTNKAGAVSGSASSDSGTYAVKWWDGTIQSFSNGATFSKSGGGLRAFEVYPAGYLTPNAAGGGGSVAFAGAAGTSATQSISGGASGYFDGGFANGGTSAGYALGTGDFTVESWAFPTETNQSSDLGALLDTRPGSGGSGIVLWRGTNNKWVAYLSASGNSLQIAVESTALVLLNQWQHIAAVRSGNNLRLFVNGVLSGTGNVSGYDLTGMRAYVATAADNPGGSRLFRGYIDNLRIVKGVAVYTGTTTFTPPASVSAVAGTSLLIPFDSSVLTPLGQFDGFNVSGNDITSLRSEGVSLLSSPGVYQYGYQTGTYPYYNYIPGFYVPGAMEQGNLSNNSLGAAALDQFYTDLAIGSGALYVEGNPGIASDTPAIATAKGYTVYGSVPP